MIRVLVATDAWHPQVNGVVRTYERLAQEAQKLGFEVSFLSPAQFRSLPCPTYPEIRLALAGPRAIARAIEGARPDFIHIATEGPVGYMTRRYCRKMHRPFTTSYHTRFPEYVAARWPVPRAWLYRLQRRFHNAGAGIFVATPSVEADLAAHGFMRLMRWSRGVDTRLFKPRKVRLFGRGPVFLYVGRIAVEKNIKAFLDLDLPGHKVVVGSGPQEVALKRRYPDALFTGPMQGEDLARAYASADVFVFPSHTDTFGLVLLEALASGLPVADLSCERAQGRAGRLRRGRARCRSATGGARRASPRPGRGAGARPDLCLGELGAAVHRQCAASRRLDRGCAFPASAAAQKETARWGEPGRLIFMRQFGRRFGGNLRPPRDG